MHSNCSPIERVPDETDPQSAGASGQCKPLCCEPQDPAGAAAPSRWVPLRCLAVSLLDPRKPRSVRGSAIENLRCLSGVKGEASMRVAWQGLNERAVMTPRAVLFFIL